MMQHKLLTTSILALGLAGAAQAAELGDIAPRSYIGQPLAVDIELVALTPEEVAGLQARLAAADVYRGANVNMNPALSTVRMAVERRGQKSVLHVTTTRAVEADYLHVYIELGVPGKQDVRLATVWLQRDPNPPPPPAPVVVAAVTPPMPPASAMTPAQAEQITAQVRAARAAAADAAKPAVAVAPAPAPAPMPERAKPAPLPSVHEAETGKPGEVKAAATGQARRIAGVWVAADGKPLKPSDKDESAEVPVSVAQALLPLAPLPLPRGVKRPAPASCAPTGMSAKECVALDARNTEMSSKLTELEGKLKALQGALGGAAPAAAAQATQPGKPGVPAASAASAGGTAAPAGPAGKNGVPVASAAAPAAQAAQAAKGGAQAASATASAATQADAAKAAVKSSATATGSSASAAAGGKDGHGAKDEHGGKDGASLASASMSAQGETEAHAAKAAAGASAEASASAAAASASASGEASASAAASVPTKQVRVLPKLKYKKEKEKPAEQSSSTIPLIAGGVGLLALLGGGFVFWRKRSAGSGPLKIWQGFRKKKPEEPAPAAESTPESVA
ncbi:hypothetical protein GTP46_18875 [Duganella sp. FT135W]|uniref:FimV N-terminal domain-containing protein n=1 Tax=Duganella flavida TaxID=2692175 RepID=A0A6L8KFX2_9BURK|nr:hypothetical protein [Duganella flavida]MYM24702.1 hypothetical protein [Duganella flavida]